jgi:transcriptional regulator with XRE-family HTH domain
MLKPSPPYDDLGAALRTLRVQRSWTLEEAGSEAGVATANLSRYETGEVYPSFAVLTRILTAYGTDFHGLADVLVPENRPRQPEESSDPFLAAVRGALHRLGYAPRNSGRTETRKSPRRLKSRQQA